MAATAEITRDSGTAACKCGHSAGKLTDGLDDLRGLSNLQDSMILMDMIRNVDVITKLQK